MPGCTELEQVRLPERDPGGQVLEVPGVEELRLVEAQLSTRLQEHVHIVLETEKEGRVFLFLTGFISATFTVKEYIYKHDYNKLDLYSAFQESQGASRL